MRRDIDGDQRVAGFAGRARPALAFESDLLAAHEPGRNLYLDVLAGRKVHAGLGAFGGFGEADRQRRMQILAGAGRGEFLPLGLRSKSARTAAPRAAEPVAQDILEAGATAAPRARETVIAEAETLEMTPVRPRAARLRAEAFEAAEARLALAIDFAVVERLALLIVADDLVGSIELGEPRGRLGI